MATHPIARDIYIDKGTDYSSVIELSVPYEDYDFSGSIKSSYSSPNAIPIGFAAVLNEPNKATISVTSENTLLLRRLRGVYDIFATNKTTGDVHKEREGTAHYTESASNDPIPLPPPQGYQIVLADVADAGSAAAADVGDFATANQGLIAEDALALAETALQPEEFRHSYDPNTSTDYTGRAPLGSLENQLTWTITRLVIATDGSVITTPSAQLERWTDRNAS